MNVCYVLDNSHNVSLCLFGVSEVIGEPFGLRRHERIAYVLFPQKPSSSYTGFKTNLKNASSNAYTGSNN